MRRTIRKNLTADNYLDLHEVPATTGTTSDGPATYGYVEQILESPVDIPGALTKVMEITVPSSGLWYFEMFAFSEYVQDPGQLDTTQLGGYLLVPGADSTGFPSFLEMTYSSNQGINSFRATPTMDTTTVIPEWNPTAGSWWNDSLSNGSHQVARFGINIGVDPTIQLWLASRITTTPTAPSNGAERHLAVGSTLRATKLTQMYPSTWA